MQTEGVPWIFAVLTSGWFGWMAYRAGRSWMIWAVGGAAFGLVGSTLVLGLGHASSIPFSEHQRRMDQLKWIAAAALLIALIGWLLTAGLHRLFLHKKATPPASAGTNPPKSSPPSPTKA